MKAFTDNYLIIQMLLILVFLFTFSCSDDDLQQEKLAIQDPIPELSPEVEKKGDEVSDDNSDSEPIESTEEEEGVIIIPETENDSTEVEEGNVPTSPETRKTENLPCSTGSKPADESGAKVWCWKDMTLPSEQGFFDNYKLFVSSHCSSNMVVAEDGRVHFRVNPTTPTSPSSCAPYNYRAEIREHPSDADYPIGTEQWWGFDYKFGDDYIADELPWILWQTHGSFSSPSHPMTNLQLGPTNYSDNINPVGELFVVNNTPAAGHKFTPVGIVPKAGQTLKIVIHLVWGDESNGLYEVWVDGVKVYGKQERTIYAEKPYGGYWKIGIYKWRWKQESNVLSSEGRGINNLNTSIGTLRTIMRYSGDTDYGTDSYSLVVPD